MNGLTLQVFFHCPRLSFAEFLGKPEPLLIDGDGPRRGFREDFREEGFALKSGEAVSALHLYVYNYIYVYIYI